MLPGDCAPLGTVSGVTSSASGTGLVAALLRLRGALAALRLKLEVDGIAETRSMRRAMAEQIDDYLAPRLRDLGAPLLVVVGGGTGAGKSTLVNSIAGRELSPAGVLRPTTRSPVLIANRAELAWFEGDRVLPSLSRATGAAADGGGGLRLVADDDVPSGMALLDAPDIDSIVTGNRELAAQLLAAADLWLFVTTAARYADAVPWQYLRSAAERSTALAVVLNRVPADAEAEVTAHLGEMLEREDLGRARVYTITETLLEDGLIPEEGTAQVRDWLASLAGDAEERAALVRMTLEGALDSLEGRVDELGRAVAAQAEAAAALRSGVERAYRRARDDTDRALSGGALLRGEVLARWQELVGTGDFMKSLESRIGFLRDRVRGALTGKPTTTARVEAALESSVETVVVEAANRAAEAACDAWRGVRGGAGLIDGPLCRASPGLTDAVAAEVREWQGHVMALVSAEGASKRSLGRALSLGVNAIGVALMVAVFAQTGGLTGGEIAVAGGTATVGQKLLEALFGDQAVRTLTQAARTDLSARIERLLEAEAERFHELAAAASPEHGEADALQAAAAQVRAERR